jgi:hypothetical protein
MRAGPHAAVPQGDATRQHPQNPPWPALYKRGPLFDIRKTPSRSTLQPGARCRDGAAGIGLARLGLAAVTTRSLAAIPSRCASALGVVGRRQRPLSAAQLAAPRQQDHVAFQRLFECDGPRFPALPTVLRDAKEEAARHGRTLPFPSGISLPTRGTSESL